jgi:hypothetical protein
MERHNSGAGRPHAARQGSCHMPQRATHGLPSTSRQWHIRFAQQRDKTRKIIVVERVGAFAKARGNCDLRLHRPATAVPRAECASGATCYLLRAPDHSFLLNAVNENGWRQARVSTPAMPAADGASAAPLEFTVPQWLDRSQATISAPGADLQPGSPPFPAADRARPPQTCPLHARSARLRCCPRTLRIRLG